MRDLDSLSWHDPLTSHLVKSVLAFKSGRVGAVFGRADPDTELVDSHVAEISAHKSTRSDGSGRGLGKGGRKEQVGKVERRNMSGCCGTCGMGNDSLHPFLVVDILAGDVRGNVSTDGVTVTGSSVGVKLTSHVAFGDVNLGEVSPSTGC